MKTALAALITIVLAGPPPAPLPTVALPKRTIAKTKGASLSLSLSTADVVRILGQAGTISSTGSNRVLEWKQDGWSYTGEFDAAGKRVRFQSYGDGVPNGLNEAQTVKEVLAIMEDEPPLTDAKNVIERRTFTFADGSKIVADLRGGKLTTFSIADEKPPVFDTSTQAWAASKKVKMGMTLAEAEAIAGKPVASTVTNLRELRWKTAPSPDFWFLQAEFDEAGKLVGGRSASGKTPRPVAEATTLAEIEKLAGAGTPTGKTTRVEIRDYALPDKSRLQIRFHDGKVYDTSTAYFPYD